MKNRFKNYKECIDYLYNLQRAGIKYDLTNIKSLLKFLDNPEKNFKSIHVAGTNGKGSVSSMLNSILFEKGFKTGLYTSPHVRDFRERILYNGSLISKNFILKFVNYLYRFIEEIRPSFFEVTTAMAFEYFSKKKVDYAVIETGLGGRLDSTNVINPILSVITSIDIDHTDFLGTKVESITFEKAGIIKKNVSVIAGNLSATSINILKKISGEKNSDLILSKSKLKIEINKRLETGFYFDVAGKEYMHKNIFLPVVGDYQINNIKTTYAALAAIEQKEKISFSKKEISNGIKNVGISSRFYARFDMISNNPKIVIDVSHNLQGIKNIKKNLEYFRYRKLIIIFAMMKDKQYEKCIRELTKLNAFRLIFTSPNYKRSADPKVLMESVIKYKNKFEVKANVKDAFDYAKRISAKNDLILITGSFFLVSDFLELKER